MAKLKSRTQAIYEDLSRDDRVKILSTDKSSAINHKMAIAFKEVMREFELKEKNSREFVKKIELTSLNK